MRERMFFFKKYQNCGSINDEYGQCSSLSLKKQQHRIAQTLVVERKKKPSIWQSKLH